MAEIELDQVTKVYYGSDADDRGKVLRYALRDLSLKIGDKEFMTLTGPAESGKTTLLRLITGLEDADRGEVRIDGKSIDSKDSERRNIGMVFQSGSLYPHMTVFKNLAFPLKKLRLTKEETERRVLEAAGFLNVEGLLSMKPKQLSREENQRVAIARAIVSNPDVVVMDEPLARLDSHEQAGLRADLIRLREKRMMTVVYAAFDEAEAMALGDRVVMMEDGRIVSVRTPEELFREMNGSL